MMFKKKKKERATKAFGGVFNCFENRLGANI